MSLLEVLLGLALFGAMTMGMATAMKYFSRSIGGIKLQMTKGQVFHSLTKALVSIDNLHFTANTPGNSLGACVYGTGACAIGAWADFDLHTVPAVAGAPTKRISGTRSNPVYYSPDGVICAAPGASCPFRVYTQFQPICPHTANCTVPDQVNLDLYFEQVDDRVLAGAIRVGKKHLDPPPNVLVVDIRHDARVCPEGNQFQGLSADGKPVCTEPCVAGNFFHGLDAEGTPICAPSPTCAPGKFYQGLDASNHPLCLDTPSCPAGKYFQGMDASNRPVCLDGPSSGECPYPQFVSDVVRDNGTVKVRCGSFPAWNGNCPPGQVAVGFVMNTNQIQCLPVTDVLPTWGGNCPPGQFAVGFAMNTNQIQCLPLPLPDVILVSASLSLYSRPGLPQCSSLEAPPVPDPFIPPGESAPKQRFRNHFIGVAKCPAGYRAAGGGADCQVPGNAGTMMASTPISVDEGSNNGWKVDCCNYLWQGMATEFPSAVFATCIRVQ